MHWTKQRSRRPLRSTSTLAALLLGMGVLPALQPLAAPSIAHAASRAAASPTCQLDPAHGKVKHVIFIEFDNVHFKRDPARNGSTNVPSDLEQMPHLLNFIKNNGVLLTNHHTPLISHTSDDIASAESGFYPSNDGVANSANSYYINSNGTPIRTSGFTYWTSKVVDGLGNAIAGDNNYNFVDAQGKNAPAPWVPYTRAGCNVGAAGMSGFVLENKNDIGQAFGTSSPQYTDPNGQDQTAKYIGVAVHCAQGDALCADTNGGAADVLPDEPGGYSGYNALYGHASLTYALTETGQIAPTQPLTDINGNPIVNVSYNFSTNMTTTVDGFPSFSLAPQFSLGYVADMQEHGIPVTYAYIITAHRPLPRNPYGYGHPEDTRDYGPGEAHYVDQLKQYDDAFAAFFKRLAHDGINKSNTLFVVTTDEADHDISENPSPANCDGAKITTTATSTVVTPDIPCTYPVTPATATNPVTTSLGELALNYNGILTQEQGINATLAQSATVNNDDAPDIYLNGTQSAYVPPSSGALSSSQTDRGTRLFERATGALTATNPLSAAVGLPSTDIVAQYMADPTEFKILHMLTADPARTPNYVAFGQPDYYIQAGARCSGPDYNATCVTQTPSFNWNHGDVQPQITHIWLGLVGPGVQNIGQDSATFTDHPDIHATINALLGLHDDYSFPHDGRAIVEVFKRNHLPASLRNNSAYLGDFEKLGQVYKQLNAPVGQFGTNTLISSTLALRSGSASDDSTYTTIEDQLTSLGNQRDQLVGKMIALLDGVSFDDQPFDQAADRQAHSLIDQGNTLLQASTPGSSTGPGGGTITPELGSGELLVAGLGPIVAALLYRRRRQRRASRRTA